MPAAVPAGRTIESAVDAWATSSAGQKRRPGRQTIQGGANVAMFTAVTPSSATIHGHDSVWTTSQTSAYDASDGRKKTNVPAITATATRIRATRFQFTRRCSLKSVVVEVHVPRHAVLQRVDGGERGDREAETGHDRRCHQADPEPAARQPPPGRREMCEAGEDVNGQGA